MCVLYFNPNVQLWKNGLMSPQDEDLKVHLSELIPIFIFCELARFFELIYNNIIWERPAVINRRKIERNLEINVTENKKGQLISIITGSN